MSKQDGYASRTATDLERKYNFGQTFAEVYGLVSDAQKTADEAQAAFDNLDQEQIFNLLTNFGAAQGVYRENGNVYVNASYIKSGKLAAEYIDAENLKVAAANITGTLVASQIDTKDLKVLAANITGKLTAAQIEALELEVSAAQITGTLKASQIDATSLKINAANITGMISANQIDAESLSVKAANITGTLSASQINTTNLYVSAAHISGTLSASKISGGTLNFDTITATNLTVNAADIGGTLSSAYISATRVTAGTLDASNITLSSGYGGFGIAYGAYTDPNTGQTSTTYGAKMYGSSSSTYLIVTGSGVRMQSSGANFYVSGSVIKASTKIEDGTSDRRLKQDITYDVEKYRAFFRKLKPCFFRYKTDPTSPMFCGFIAQEVEEALTESGLTRMDFFGVRGGELDEETGEPSEYGLVYSEFIPLLTDAVQDIYSRLETVENNLGG